MAKQKVDAEALKKNTFWIGLGAFALLWMIALVVVLMSGDATAKSAYEKSKTEIEGRKGKKPKTVAYQAPWKEHGEKFKKKKDEVWGEAWAQQEGMYTWPEVMTFHPNYPADVWPDDLNSRGRFPKQYATQFVGLNDYVRPVELNGGLAAIVPEQKWDDEKAPTREEIWLAQEDFWVRRELLYVVRGALDSIAYCTPIPAEKGEELPKGVAARQRFRNSNWELDLQFEAIPNSKSWKLSPLSTIKNVSVTGKTMLLANPRTNNELGFLLYQNKATFRLFVSGEPLPYMQSTNIKVDKNHKDVGQIVANKPFGVTQMLEWELSPIRRIDAIELGYHSHRTFTAGLVERPELKALDTDPNKPTDNATGGAQGGSGGAAGGGPAGGPGGGMAGMGGSLGPPGGKGMPGGGMAGGGMAGGGMAGGDKPVGDLTPVNKIDRQRYMHVKPQARHLPLAMRLIVEQSQIHEVLAAVTNSRLRIQITQLSVNHAKDVKHGDGKAGKNGDDNRMMPPAEGGKGGSSLGPIAPMLGSFPRAKGMRGSGSSLGPPPATIGMPGSGDYGSKMPKDGMRKDGKKEDDRQPDAVKEGANAMGQDPAQLVELTIYGVATLYERPPAKKADQPEGGNVVPPQGGKQ